MVLRPARLHALQVEAGQYPTWGVTDAQVHLRHLAGGRARSYTGGIPWERIFNTTFPERAGALRTFLKAVSPTWNVTLFHYRDTGPAHSSTL